MRRTSMVTSLLLQAVLAAPARDLSAQVAPVAEQRLEEAIRQELVLGELDRAITIYREILTRYPRQRTVSARALAYLGRAYEKLGSREAQAAYQRVVREFADQTEPAQFARGRLQALSAANGAGRGPLGRGLTMLLAELPILRPRDNAQFDFSPDGEQVVFRTDVDSNGVGGVALMVANSRGTIVRTLLPAAPRMGRISPRWSPDGKYIAFIQRSFLEVDSAFGALMVVPAEGGPAQIVTRQINPRPGPARGGLFWTPDSRGITVGTPPGLVTYDLHGNVIRTLPATVPFRTQYAGYSPDGRWIAYHKVESGTRGEDHAEVWIVPATGGTPVQISRSGDFDGWPSWSRDGRALYFVSDRGGSSNIWRVNLDPESGQPRGEPAAVTSYSDATLIYPRLIDGGRRLAFVVMRQTGAIHVGPAEAPDRGRVVARGSNPLLSPDGQTVYFMGDGSGQPGIFAQSVTGGPPRRLTSTSINGDAFQRYALSRDGASLAYFSGSGASNVLYVAPTAGGAAREVVRLESREHLVPSFSPDGTRLGYTHGDGLYAVAVAGGQPTRLAQLTGWEGWMVRWSPDGAHIAAFGYAAANQSNAIFVVPAAGGELRRLTPPEERWYKEGLEWHPDSRRLSYMYYGPDDKGDGSRVAYLDGRPTSRLVDQPNPLWDYVGRWHPTGGDYYFVSSGLSRSWDLFRHDATAGTTHMVWPHGSAEPGVGVPAFSADGRVMAWRVSRSTRQIWSIDLEP